MRDFGSLPKPRRGEIWLADLDPTIGRGLGRVPRPVLIVSANTMNEGAFQRVIVVPSTTKKHDIPCHVPLARRTPDGNQTSYYCCEDVRSISILRLQRLLSKGSVPTSSLAQVEEWLRTLLAL
jgi:mRNA interferase MazF